MNKFVLLTIFLIVSGALAHRHEFEHKFARHHGNHGHHGHHAHHAHTANADNTDFINFAKGFLRGVGEDSVFDRIKLCLSDSKTFYNDVSKAIADIKTKDPVKVKEGIILLGQAAQLIPTAARDCKAAEEDIAKLIKLAKAFSSPTAFFYAVGKSLLVNRVEVIREVNNAVSAYQSRDYYTLGYWVGKAMDTIFLGTNQKLRQSIVDHINTGNFGWKAEINPKFAGLTLEEIKTQFLGAPVPEEMYEGIPTFEPTISKNDIPTHFNASEEWPDCIHPILDQGRCGSCWAFAASEVLSDRFCIASKGAINVVLSSQYMVSCDTSNFGCNGGYPLLSWWFIAQSGLVTESCWPYASSSGVSPKCSEFTSCHDGQPTKFYKAIRSTITQFTSITALQQNILQYGPVEAAFTVYEDFMNYKSGIYKHTSGSLLGGHAVKIIGWGNEDGTDYWIVANSWSTSWGMDGFFKIAFGQCGIDKACLAGQPDLSNTQSFLWQ